jgi:hypothetical protein
VDFFDPAEAKKKPPLDLVAKARRVLGPPIVDDDKGGGGDGGDGDGDGDNDGGEDEDERQPPDDARRAPDNAKTTTTRQRTGVTKLLSIFKWEARKAPEAGLYKSNPVEPIA